MRLLLVFVLSLAVAAGADAAPSAQTEVTARQVWQLLDYVAVDYAGAVANGAVVAPSEYAEMKEFSATAKKRLQELPEMDGKGGPAGESRCPGKGGREQEFFV